MRSVFKDICFNPLLRAEEITRYSGTYQTQPESLAVHVHDTMMMAYIIACELNSFDEKLNLGLLLEKCLLHDLDETITGDIPRNTKYANPRIKQELDNLQDEVLEIIRQYINNDNVIEICKTAKAGKEGLILKLADMLGVARRALLEIRMRGNKSFLRVVEELGDHLDHLANSLTLKDFSKKSQEWIVALIADARDAVKELHYSHVYDVRDFNIVENVLHATDYQGKGKKSCNGKKPIGGNEGPCPKCGNPTRMFIDRYICESCGYDPKILKIVKRDH